MTKVFLTGGSGFIGTEVARLALERGLEVVNYDFAAPRLTEHRSFWIDGDVRDADKLQQAVQSTAPDVIIHLASETDHKIIRMEDFTGTIGGTRNAAEAAKVAPNLRKFVHISTQFVVTPGVKPPAETYFEPHTIYGEAKAVTERLVRAANLSMPWLIVRPTIIWGPHHPSFADHIFKHIASRTYLHPVGREKTMRTFGYVTNTAHQILTLALSEAGSDDKHVFYAGDGTLDYEIWADAFSTGLTGKRVRRVPIWLLNTMGRVGDVMKRLHLPAPIDSGRAFRMSTSSAIDVEPTLAQTGTPPVPFEEGVRRTLDWLNQRTS